MDGFRRRLIDLAKEQGWTVENTKQGHHVFVAPSGERIVDNGRNSARRNQLNTRARLRKAGLEC